MKGNYENQNFGVKLTNELMTDIIGAIIPGALFIVCLVISVVIPLMICLSKSEIISYNNISAATPWVVLILGLILSYVFGLLFYRADIKIPDKVDIERQIIETVVNYSDRDENFFYQEICAYVKALGTALEGVEPCSMTEPASSTLSVLKNACDSFKMQITSSESMIYHNHLILELLFPEDYVNGNMHLSHYSSSVFNYYKTLFLNLYNVYNSYERHICLSSMYFLLDNKKVRGYKESQAKAESLQEYTEWSKMSEFNFSNIEDACYFNQYAKNDNFRKVLFCMYASILNTQCELGCCSKHRGEFPYMNYYKYLLKRNLMECVKHVDWCTRESRSKNQLNEYKIEIQVFASEAYALLNKNESHIRMSSASWHVSYRIRVISFSMILLILIMVPSLHFIHDSGIELSLLALSLFPISIFMLSSLIKRRIIKFIHYQRLREIYYTLHVYNDYQSIIDRRKAVMSQKEYYFPSK